MEQAMGVSMELEIGIRKEVEGLALEEVIFRGSYARGDRAAKEELCGVLEDLLKIHDPNAVLMNLLCVDEILVDDLHDLASVAIGVGRKQGPRVCSIVVRANTTLVTADGRPAHSFGMPGLHRCGPLRDNMLLDLEERLADLALEPKGRQPIYFPVGSLDTEPRRHEILANWFSKYLWRMQEPSLADLSRRSDFHGYRFLWLPTFHEPVCIRLEIDPKGAGVLTLKKTSGQGGYFPGKLVVNESRALPRQTADSFLKHLGQARFWGAGIARVEQGLDGSEWIIEGAKSRCFRVKHEWSPKTGAFREAALFLLELSGMEIGRIY